MLFYLTWSQFRHFMKNPILVGLMISGPFLIIFVLGQALYSSFASWNDGPSSMEYFMVLFLNMAVLYTSMGTAWGLNKERTRHTLTRLKIAPISQLNTGGGLFLGAWAASFVMIISVYILCRLLLNVDSGLSDIKMGLLLLSGTFFASSLGFFITLILKDEKNHNGLLNTTIPLMIFLGGGYIPIPSSGILYKLSFYSPVRWMILKMLDVYYPQLNIAYIKPVLVTSIPGLVLLILSGLIIKKRGLQ